MNNDKILKPLGDSNLTGGNKKIPVNLIL